MPLERLDKTLSKEKNISRKDVNAWIKNGRIMVNGDYKVRRDMKIDLEKDQVVIDNEPLKVISHIYVMMNKPKDIISASRDKTRKTVLDLLPDDLQRRGLFPAGRLDRDTTGFMLITDDGTLAHRLLSPKHHVKKTYRAVLDRPFPRSAPARFREGIALRDGTVCRPAELFLLESAPDIVAEVVLQEGRYHQVRRMFAAVGCRVLQLHRTRVGDLPLDPGLRPGQCRQITSSELDLLVNVHKDGK